MLEVALFRSLLTHLLSEISLVVRSCAPSWILPDSMVGNDTLGVVRCVIRTVDEEATGMGEVQVGR